MKKLFIIDLLPLMVGCAFKVTKTADGVKATGKGTYTETANPDGGEPLIAVDTKGEPILNLGAIKVED